MYTVGLTIQIRLTYARGEGISSKARVANTVKGPIGKVSTDALSIHTTCGKVTQICTYLDDYKWNQLIHIMQRRMFTVYISRKSVNIDSVSGYQIWYVIFAVVTQICTQNSIY